MTSSTYIDCGSGVAGDMLIGALVQLGLSPRELNTVLHRAIPVKGWTVKVTPTERHMWPASAVTVEGDRPFGSAQKMKRVIASAGLPEPVKRNALAVMSLLQKAEAHAHGGSHTHFEDQGLALLDTLVDVLGSTWGFWRLGIDAPQASAVYTGRLAPAASWIIKEKKIPVYTDDTRLEMATPTGIAILSVLVDQFGPMAPSRLESSGYGAGQKDIPNRPNVLAIHRSVSARGVKAPGTESYESEGVLILETVIDDMDPRIYPYVTDLLLSAGALDAWLAPIGMKKGRPGISYTVLCRPELESAVLKILFRETTTLGIRRTPVSRWVLPRRSKGLHKTSVRPGWGKNNRVEFERAKEISRKRAIPLLKLLK